MRRKIGECLIQAGLITEEDLRNALAEHKRTRDRLGVVLARMNLATEEQIAKTLAFQLGFPYVNLTENRPDPAFVVLIPKDVAVKRVCVAVGLEHNLLVVAMSDPLLFSLVQDLESQTGYRIKQVVATRADIIDAIQTFYPAEALAIGVPELAGDVLIDASAQRGEDAAVETTFGRRVAEEMLEPVASLRERSGAAPIVDLVDLVVKSAIKSKATDVHVEPMAKNVLIRHRLDGVLIEAMNLPRWVHEGLVARLKIVAGMNIAEKRLPQDGRLRSTAEDGTEVDFRVSTLRTLFGEKVVMRILDRRRSVPSLEEIGMSAAALDDMRALLRRQQGMILVAGPTGSGKTTTLNSSVRSVQSEKTNIITIEDPIEYQIPGVNQTQIDNTINLTFASALGSILRQDPDVILLGEIRDGETAKLAMQAAQTGHLVLSALHADDAPSVVARLIDSGTEPFVIASALVGVVAQRLVRRLCVQCRRQYTPRSDVLRLLNIAEIDAASMPFYESVGCDECNHTGFRGRIGIYEVMRVTDKLRRLIAAGATEDQIREVAIAGGMITLGEDGLAKVKSGVTTAEELLRVVPNVRETRTLCAACGRAVGVEFNVCPHCGERVGGGCRHCGRALRPGWNFCPYCARSTSEKRASKRLRDRDMREGGRELPGANVAEFKK